MVETFLCLCLASKKPSEQKFFVPAGTDLAVKLSTKNSVLNIVQSYHPNKPEMILDGVKDDSFSPNL